MSMHMDSSLLFLTAAEKSTLLQHNLVISPAKGTFKQSQDFYHVKTAVNSAVHTSSHPCFSLNKFLEVKANRWLKGCVCFQF